MSLNVTDLSTIENIDTIVDEIYSIMMIGDNTLDNITNLYVESRQDWNDGATIAITPNMNPSFPAVAGKIQQILDRLDNVFTLRAIFVVIPSNQVTTSYDESGPFANVSWLLLPISETRTATAIELTKESGDAEIITKTMPVNIDGYPAYVDVSYNGTDDTLIDTGITAILPKYSLVEADLVRYSTTDTERHPAVIISLQRV